MDGIKRKASHHEPVHHKEEVLHRVPVEPSSEATFQSEEVILTAASTEDRIESNPFFKKEKKSHTPHHKVVHHRPKHHSALPSKKLVIGFSSVLTLAVAGFFITAQFSSAVIEVVPRSESAAIDTDFSAFKDVQDASMQFHFMSLQDEKTKDVPATVEEKVQKKASGRVVIYNAYSGASQRLIKNTRLETPDHKIFRIDESIVVPGATMSGSQVTTPGSVEAVVYADAPGKEYNIGLADFTIPGFKGDPRYAAFTARSKADSPIMGGFSGTVKVPAPNDILAATQELKEELKRSAVEKARAEMPEDVTFFPGSMVVKFEEVPQDLSVEGGSSHVSVRATVSVFFFDTDALTRKLAEGVLPGYANTPLNLVNKDEIMFAFTEPVDSLVLSDLSRIKFHLTGNAVFEGRIDADKLARSLAGKDKDMLAGVVSEDPNIKKVTPKFFPTWSTTFPRAAEKISIKIIQE